MSAKHKKLYIKWKYSVRWVEWYVLGHITGKTSQYKDIWMSFCPTCVQTWSFPGHVTCYFKKKFFSEWQVNFRKSQWISGSRYKPFGSYKQISCRGGRKTPPPPVKIGLRCKTSVCSWVCDEDIRCWKWKRNEKPFLKSLMICILRPSSRSINWVTNWVHNDGQEPRIGKQNCLCIKYLEPKVLLKLADKEVESS